MKIGPKYKLARRLGDAIFPKTQKGRFAMVESKKRLNMQKRRKHRSNTTEYGTQFIEKQKLRYTYGLGEKQLSNYIGKAKQNKNEKPVDELYKLLERRLDNVVFRIGLAVTRQFGRQMVSHGHIAVNGKRVSIPSYSVKLGDKISIMPRSSKSPMYAGKQEALKEFKNPTWLTLNPDTLEGEVKGNPLPGEFEGNLNFGTVVQFYSRV